MCIPSKPSAPPAPAAPTPPAEVKQPDTVQAVREKRKASGSGIAGGTLLTGPGGVMSTDLNVGKPTLLGQ